MTKEKPVTQMVMKLETESFLSKQTLSRAAQTATSQAELPEQLGPGQEQLLLCSWTLFWVKQWGPARSYGPSV